MRSMWGELVETPTWVKVNERDDASGAGASGHSAGRAAQGLAA